MPVALQFSHVTCIAPAVVARGETQTLATDFLAQDVVQSPPPDATPRELGSKTSPDFVVKVSQIRTWSKSQERKFSDLVAKKALGKATEGELAEIEALTVARRRHRNPQSADEVVFQYKRRQMESQLLRDLKGYVQFLETPRHASA